MTGYVKGKWWRGDLLGSMAGRGSREEIVGRQAAWQAHDKYFSQIKRYYRARADHSEQKNVRPPTRNFTKEWHLKGEFLLVAGEHS